MRLLVIVYIIFVWQGCMNLDSQTKSINSIKAQAPIKSCKDSLFEVFLSCLSDSDSHRIVSVQDKMEVDYDALGHDRFCKEIIEYSTNVKEIKNMIDSFGDFKKVYDTISRPVIRILQGEISMYFICHKDTILNIKLDDYYSPDESLRLFINGTEYLTNAEAFLHQLRLLERRKKLLNY